MRDSRKKEKERLMSSILPQVMRNRGWEAQLKLHSIFPNWQKVVDETTAVHAKPLKIVKGTLWVEVENSAWLQQFQFQKVFLLKSINNFLKDVSIKDIRFTLPQAEEQPESEEPRVHFVAPPEDELKKFQEQAGFIEDDEAREALIHFWYMAKACVRK